MSNEHIGRSVSIIGAAYTKLGQVGTTPEIKDFTEKELYAAASIEAMENGGIDACDIAAFYVGMSGPEKSKIKSGTPHFSEWVGMRGKPGLFYDGGCGTAGIGLQMAVNAVASGNFDVVLSGAVNIMSTVPYPGVPPFIRRDLPHDEFWAGIYTGLDSNYEKIGDGGSGSIEAQCIDYARKYGLTYEQMDEAQLGYIVKSREGAVSNPKAANAHMSLQEEAEKAGFTSPREYLINDKMNPVISSCFRVRFLGTPSDGAAAVIVCASDLAHRYTDKPVRVAGIATCTQLHKEMMVVPDSFLVDMYQKAYDMAGIKDPFNEIDYMAIHDVPAFQVAIQGENAGYFKPGTAWKYMMEGRCGFDGDRPVSTQGGCFSCGHPLSPKFNIEVTEAIKQMRGECGARQIPKPPETALIYCGGSGWHHVGAVLKYDGKE